jgi:hypothetical protein
VQQGVQSFFATQRILLDLAMRQNANMMHALREQLTHPQHSPSAILNEMAGEGMANFLDGQKVLLNLSKQQNHILMEGVKDRLGEWPAAHAFTDALRRSVETFLVMQEEFLKMAKHETHAWMEAAKTGKAYDSDHFVDLAREGMENLVKAQKQFLDIIAEETTKVASGKHNGAMKKMKKPELSTLVRQATESFIEAPKQLVDLAAKQMNANVKTAAKTLELLRPLPFLPLADVARETVKSYVDAQKAVMEAVVKPRAQHKPVTHKTVIKQSKKAARKSKEAAMAAVA